MSDLKKEKRSSDTRRDFMKVAGIGAATLAMPGLIRNASATPASGIS